MKTGPIVYALLTFLVCPLLTMAQLQVSFPTSRAVFQRSLTNSATIRINGYYTAQVSRIEARLRARDGQGASTDWATIQTNPQGGAYAGDLTGQGGWYNLEVRGMAGDQQVGNVTTIERVGIGEVFVIAGQSNAQGMYADVPGATDDRVNCINYYNGSDSQDDPSSDVFGQFTHLDQGVRIAPRSIGSWCWGTLGDLLARRLNVPVLFFNSGWEGTTVGNWRQSAENGITGSIYIDQNYPVGQPYANLRTALRFYTNMLGIRAILWHQGEAEGFINTSTDQYANDLQFLINRSRQDAGKNISWLVSRVSYTSDFSGVHPAIIAAQYQVISSVPNVFAGPETDNIQIPRFRAPRYDFARVHFDNEGLIDVANAWNNSLSDGFFASSQPQAPAPAPTLTISCAGANQLSIAVNGAYSSYSWNTGDNGATLVKGSGEYRAKVRDGSGNVVFSPVARVAAAPNIQQSGPAEFCEGGNVTLTSDYSTNITWNTGFTGQSLTTTTAGDYAVRYRDVSGCDFNSATVSTKVNPLPAAPSVTAETSTTFCQGQTTTLTASDAFRYNWSSGQNSRSINVSSPGTYSLTITDQKGCTSARSNEIPVVVNPLPATPVITASGATTFCADQSVVLTATEENAYSWTTGQNTRAVTITGSGTYALQTRNVFNCLSASSNSITVQVNPLPPAPILTASGQTTFCEGNRVSLIASSPLKLSWNTGASTDTITVDRSGSYTARVSDAIGCLSPSAPAIVVDAKPLPGVPTIAQIGTYTLEAQAPLAGTYYVWRHDTDSLAVRTPIIKAIRSGLYTVRSFITYSPVLTCSSVTSAAFTFFADETNGGVSIYPNPSPDGLLELEAQENLADATVTIYTLSGQLVYSQLVPIFDERKQLDLTTLTPGSYILQVSAANYRIAKRILVKL